jgi:hypothetical protein
MPVGLQVNMDLASSSGIDHTIITKDDSDWCWQGGEEVKPIAVRAHGAWCPWVKKPLTLQIRGR